MTKMDEAIDEAVAEYMGGRQTPPARRAAFHRALRERGYQVARIEPDEAVILTMAKGIDPLAFDEERLHKHYGDMAYHERRTDALLKARGAHCAMIAAAQEG